MNNHREIMEALLQGKKIGRVREDSNEYIFLNDAGELETESKEICDRLDLCVNYEEYIEYVDFFTMIKHVLNGRKAKRKYKICFKDWEGKICFKDIHYPDKTLVYDEPFSNEILQFDTGDIELIGYYFN